MLKALADARVPDEGLDLFGERYGRMATPSELPQALKEIYPLKELYVKRTNIPLKAAYTPEIVELCAADITRLAPMYHLLRKAADEGMAAEP